MPTPAYSALIDLQQLYATDPLAVAVDVGAGNARRRARGFLSVRRTPATTEGFSGYVLQTTLRVLVGSLGTPAPDTALTIAGTAYRLLGLEPADGDGLEELAIVVKA
jgi:hypothetical protein